MNTPTTPTTPTSIQRRFYNGFHQNLNRNRNRNRNRQGRNMARVSKPLQGMLFDSPYCQQNGFVLAIERKWPEFFPRLFRVNQTLAQTLLYGHFHQQKWLDYNLYNKKEFFVNLRLDEKCFIELLGWNYLEFCEEQANTNSFPFNHFLWWCNNVNVSTDKHFCGR
jgi:hypothetical protein